VWRRLTEFLPSRFTLVDQRHVAFGSPESAQFWYEWKQKGLMLPIVVGIAMAGLAVIAISAGRMHEAMTVWPLGFASGLPLLSIVTGVLIGRCSPSRERFDIGSFLATRPINDHAISAAIIKTALLDSFCGWALWLFFLVPGVFLGSQARDYMYGTPESWIGPVVSCLATTMVIVVWSACLIMTGRPKIVPLVLTGLVTLGLALMLVPQYMIPLRHRNDFGALMAVPFGLGSLYLAARFFFVARIRGLIGVGTIFWALLIWVGLRVAIYWGSSTPSVPDPTVSTALDVAMRHVLLPGLLALVVAPLAAGPLAVAWNRHR
jgi:hypothetical protein